jgi:hypothetical protein
VTDEIANDQQLTFAECDRSVITTQQGGVCLSPRDEVIEEEEPIYGSPEHKGQQLKHWHSLFL